MREIQRYTRDANAKLSGGWGLFLAASFRDYCHGGGEVCGKTSIKTEVECFKWREVLSRVIETKDLRMFRKEQIKKKKKSQGLPWWHSG